MRPTFRLVSDFILPNLNKSTYGSHLLWEDKRNGSFKISRIHQSSDMWNEQCIEVYKAWSMIKKHWNANDPRRITKAKHRLITALRRSPEVEILEKESTFYRFRIIHPGLSDDSLNDENSTSNNVSVEPIQTEPDQKKYSEEVKEMEIISMLDITEENKDQKDQSTLNNFETHTNLTSRNLYHSDVHDEQKLLSIPDDIFVDELLPTETKSTVFSDKCCCEKLLDIYLCDQKCIWHGMPP